jgi:zinc transport system ATP-binding protein
MSRKVGCDYTVAHVMAEVHSSNPAVSIRSVTLRYPGAEQAALSDVSLDVMAGEKLGILGPNGGGKSTLVKLVLGLLTPGEGTIAIWGMSPREARREGIVGYVPQRVEAELGFPLSGRDVVTMAAGVRLGWWQRASVVCRDMVEAALGTVNAQGFADQPVGTLSGGQFQRVMIARAIVTQPKVLVLDEPTVGIDVAGQKQFAELIERLSRELKMTLLVVSHDLRTIASGCDRVACLSRTLHSHGAPEGLTPKVLAEVFRHDMASIFGDVHVDAHAAAGCSDPSHARGHTHTGPVQLRIESKRDGGGAGGGS